MCGKDELVEGLKLMSFIITHIRYLNITRSFQRLNENRCYSSVATHAYDEMYPLMLVAKQPHKHSM